MVPTQESEAVSATASLPTPVSRLSLHTHTHTHNSRSLSSFSVCRRRGLREGGKEGFGFQLCAAVLKLENTNNAQSMFLTTAADGRFQVDHHSRKQEMFPKNMEQAAVVAWRWLCAELPAYRCKK